MSATEKTPAAPPSSGGMARLRDAFLHPGRGQVVVGLLMAALAFAAVTQVRERGESDPYAGLRQADLVQALNGLSAATTRSQAEIAELEKTRADLQSSTQQRQAALDQARKELGTLGVLAGTLPATGPGISITIEADAGKYTANTLLDGIEELRDAGAEAIQINNAVRVIAQTSFTDGQKGIIVDGRELSPPYRLDVIGDPDTLANGLNISGGFRDDVELVGGTTDVKKSSKISIEVTRPAPEPRFAEGVQPVG